MKLRKFIIAAGAMSNDPNKTTTVPLTNNSGKRITIDSSHLMGSLMGLSGGTMTISDGTSNRVITFGFGASADDEFDVSSGSGPFSTGTDTGEQHIVSRINGSNGGSVNVTASNVNDDSDDAVVDIVHNAGGTVTITFQQLGASNIGSDFLVVTGISGGTKTVAAADDFITGSVTHNYSVRNPVVGKITLREDTESLGMLGVVIGKNDINNSGGKFLVTGSISGVNEPSKSDAKRVKGDVLIIAQGS